MSEEVHVYRHGAVGHISLNRPKALHALTLAMCEAMIAALLDWREDDSVEAVIVDHAEGRGFCAGGDITLLRRSALDDGGESGRHFFDVEYKLNHLMFTYPKPIVAFMDGVTMGGGVGISQPAQYRIATENTRFAMPETGIGLFPDVGGGWFLAQCPGHVGEWLALTGQAIAAGDAIEWGLGDVFVRGEHWPALVEDLRHGAQPSAEHVVASVMERADLAPVSAPKATLERIDRHFGQRDLAAILDSLAQADDDWARDTHATLLKRSPTMMAVTLELVRRGRRLGLADELRLERELVHHAFHLRGAARSETVEGIRALAVDKDHQPRWQPDTVAGVDAAEVAAFFVSPWAPAEHPLRDLR